MNEPMLLRVQGIHVEGLFQLYDHQIDLNLEDRITILHGPNGVGKTVLLRMVNALLEGRFSYFSKIPFRKFTLSFTDGARIELTKKSDQQKSSPRKFHLSLHRGDRAPQQEEVGGDLDVILLAEEIADMIRWLVRTEENSWVDERTGRPLRAEEVVDLYGDRLPSKRRPRNKAEPDWFRDFRNNVNAHLIEAQRLFRVHSAEPYRYRRESIMISTVVDYAGDLQRRISEIMAHYGRKSQTLDQTFPQRLLNGAGRAMSIADLKTRMVELEDKRDQLKGIGLLDEPVDHPFDMGALDHLDPTQKSVMTLYVSDTADKLSVLDDLANRTQLLLDNVNRKFRHKRIRIDRDKGLVAESDKGQLLELDSLSSGEQHELVLHYDLLFRVRPNTLVMIDEPELSLHVSWQKRFLPDLLGIVQTANFDALIATHSPFIVGDRSDLMVALDAHKDDLVNTRLHADIRVWEKSNRPYRILT